MIFLRIAIRALFIRRVSAISSSFVSIRFPTFIYEVEGIEMEKSVFMVYGENTTVIQYESRDKTIRNRQELAA